MPASTHACYRVAFGASAFMPPAVPWPQGCPSPQPPVGQGFPLLGLVFLLSHCRSRGLAPAKPVMWLWWVLVGSGCGSGRITFLSPASLTIAWGPGRTLSSRPARTRQWQQHRNREPTTALWGGPSGTGVLSARDLLGQASRQQHEPDVGHKTYRKSRGLSPVPPCLPCCLSPSMVGNT